MTDRPMRSSAALLVSIVAAAALGACSQAPDAPVRIQAAPVSADVARQIEFAAKEQCAAAAERIERINRTSVSEVFYSPKRNSCVCETATADRDSTYHELVDCLTRESLGNTTLQLKSSSITQDLQAWKAKKDALK